MKSCGQSSQARFQCSLSHALLASYPVHLTSSKHHPNPEILSNLRLLQNNGRQTLSTARPSRHNGILTANLRTTTSNSSKTTAPPTLQHANRRGAHGSFHHGVYTIRLQHDVYPRCEREREAVP
jgi:hypothetical protein